MKTKTTENEPKTPAEHLALIRDAAKAAIAGTNNESAQAFYAAVAGAATEWCAELVAREAELAAEHELLGEPTKPNATAPATAQ